MAVPNECISRALGVDSAPLCIIASSIYGGFVKYDLELKSSSPIFMTKPPPFYKDDLPELNPRVNVSPDEALVRLLFNSDIQCVCRNYRTGKVIYVDRTLEKIRSGTVDKSDQCHPIVINYCIIHAMGVDYTGEEWGNGIIYASTNCSDTILSHGIFQGFTQSNQIKADGFKNSSALYIGVRSNRDIVIDNLKSVRTYDNGICYLRKKWHLNYERTLVAVSPNTETIVVGNKTENKIAVLDVATGEELRSVLFYGPSEIRFA